MSAPRLRTTLPLLALLVLACVRDNGNTPPGGDPMQSRVGNNDPRGVDDQPDWEQQARELKQRVDPRLPEQLPTDKRATCTAMLDAASEFYVSVEDDPEQRQQRLAQLQATHDAELEGCIKETSVAATLCVTLLLGDRDSEFPWLLDQCSRAYPNEAGGGPLTPSKAAELELTFVGDIIFGRYRENNVFDPIIEDGFAVFDEIKPALQADVIVGNLETPVVEVLPQKSPIGAQYRFGAGRDDVKVLTAAGFTVMSLANNHYFDLREAGQTESPRILAEEGIFPIGASRTEEPLYRVETLEVEGWKIGFIAVTNRINAPVRENTPQVPYIELNDMPDQLLPLVEKARPDHDLLIVAVHWGDEYVDSPSMYHKKSAHALIDGGVDMVIGHHPHVLQGIERYNDGLIAYSLGNFLFEHTGSPPRLTGVLRTSWKTDAERARPCMSATMFHSAYNKRTPVPHPVPATGALGKQVRARLVDLSKALGSSWVQIEGTEDLRLEGQFCGVASEPAADAAAAQELAK